MTDFTDPNFWIGGAKLVWGAPQIAVPLVIGVAVAAWVARSYFASDRARNLQDQIDSLNERLKLKDDQIATAKQQNEEVAHQLTELKDRAAVQERVITALRNSLPAPARVDQLVQSNTEFQSALTSLANSTSHLGHTLTIGEGKYRLAVEPIKKGP